MSFDWYDYERLGVSLIETDTEAGFRSAISRLYYAVYNVLRIEAGYRAAKTESSHYRFIEQWKNVDDAILDHFPDITEDEIVYIGNQLDHLRKERNKADYAGADTVQKRDALDAKDKVEDIFDIINKDDEE